MTATDSTRPPAAAEPRPGPRARVGVFGIGLATYWPQFEGLRERIEGYQRRVEERVARAGRRGGLGRPRRHGAGRPRGGRPLRAPRRSTSCSATPSPTRPPSQVLPAVQAAKVPVVLLGLQPTATLDYEHIDTGEWLANCAACCVPEIAGAFTRARIPYDTVAGTIDDDERAWAKIARLGARRGRGRVAAPRADRLPRPHLSGDARPVLRLHRRARPARRARRGARDRRPRRARRRRHRGRGRGQESEIREMFDFADPSGDPIAGPIDRRAARLVGARRRRPRPARRRLRARRADLLLPRRRRQRGRAARRRRDRRQLAADRARRPDLGRGRPQDQHRPAAPRPARRGRLVHRVLRAGLRRGLRADGPRRARGTSRSRRSARCCARSSSSTASAAPA